VICCMDVFTYLSDEQIIDVITQFEHCLKPGGIILLNNNAFKAFKGAHDFHVGIGKRFVQSDFNQYAKQTNMQLAGNVYWNFLLSPLVFVIRRWKLLLYHSGIVNKTKITSDIQLPAPWINKACLQILHWEEKLFDAPAWGTSLFTILKKPADA